MIPFVPSLPSATMRRLRRSGLAAPGAAELALAEGLTELELATRYPERSALLPQALGLDLAR